MFSFSFFFILIAPIKKVFLFVLHIFRDVFPLYKISYLWHATVGALSTIILGLIVSLITGPTNPKTVNPKYIISLVDLCYCCLPEKIKRACRYWEPNEATDETEV